MSLVPFSIRAIEASEIGQPKIVQLMWRCFCVRPALFLDLAMSFPNECNSSGCTVVMRSRSFVLIFLLLKMHFCDEVKQKRQLHVFFSILDWLFDVFLAYLVRYTFFSQLSTAFS